MEWSKELGYLTPLLAEKPEVPMWAAPYEEAFRRLAQGGLEDGFKLSDLRAAYDAFPVGRMDQFFDIMLAMRGSLLTLLRKLDKEKDDG